MKIIKIAEEISDLSESLRQQKKTIALVPTMGALHAGHLSLIDAARSSADAVIVSIYLNPKQFAPGEDLNSYPRTLEEDLESCRDKGVDAVFIPSDKEMYRENHSTYVEEEQISKGLCGSSRPSHFKGVTTIVLKLFNIVRPTLAVFGRKDAQQARIIMRMVRDLNVPVQIKLAPTIREEHGLAMSSRNNYLSAAERKSAGQIYSALLEGKRSIEEGIRSAETILKCMKASLALSAEPIEIEYIEIVSDPDMLAIDPVRGNILIAIAGRIGSTRLIDNIEISVP